MAHTFCVYIHTNKINGKKYVGQTSQKPDRRFASGKGYVRCPVFRDAIKKYGWDNFSHEIVVSGLTLKEANALEEKLIKALETTKRENGYNLAFGGKNCPLCESAKKKIGDFWRGRKMAQSQKEAISRANKGKNTWSKGRHHSEETKQKMRDAHRRRQENGIYYKSKKHIICLENGVEYENAYDAARKLGLYPTNVSRSVKSDHLRAGGYSFVYKVDYDNGVRKKIPLKRTKKCPFVPPTKKVMCIETGVIYNSVRDAALEQKRKTKSLYNYLHGEKKTFAGYTWKYI